MSTWWMNFTQAATQSHEEQIACSAGLHGIFSTDVARVQGVPHAATDRRADHKNIGACDVRNTGHVRMGHGQRLADVQPTY